MRDDSLEINDPDNLALLMGVMRDTMANRAFIASIGHPEIPFMPPEDGVIETTCDVHGGEITLSKGMDGQRQKLLARGYQVMVMCAPCAIIAESVCSVPSEIYKVGENGSVRKAAGDYRSAMQRIYHP